MSNELITEKQLVNTPSSFFIVKFAFISSLNLKHMLTNSGIATIYIDIYILLFILTLKVTPQLMPEIVFIIRVSVINNAEACVLRTM